MKQEPPTFVRPQKGEPNRSTPLPFKLGSQEPIQVKVQETAKLRPSSVNHKGQDPVGVPTTTGTRGQGRGPGDSPHPRGHGPHPVTARNVRTGTQ
jgi:hypothetical protein